MEMMHMMMMMDLDEQIPLPFQDLSSAPPLMEFSAGLGGSSTSNHPSPQAVIYGRYPPPPLIMQYSSPPQLRRSGGGWPFQQQKPASSSTAESVEAMREMIFRMAALQPVQIDPESIKPPKRRNVKISKDPQSVAARHRRERISERIRILQRLVPGGTKMDTASMLDEAAHYMKFLKKQVQSLEQAAAAAGGTKTSPPVPAAVGNNDHSPHLIRACGQPPAATQASDHVLGSICGDASLIR